MYETSKKTCCFYLGEVTTRLDKETVKVNMFIVKKKQPLSEGLFQITNDM